jgi:CBS domain-containing protein
MAKAPDQVGGLMTEGVITVAPSDRVEAALRAMIDHDVGSVVIVDDGRTVGLFTERDVTRRVLDDAELLSKPVGDVMASPAITVDPSTDVVAAFELLNSRGIRRLPVVEDGRLVGIVTERDLLRWVGRVATE